MVTKAEIERLKVSDCATLYNALNPKSTIAELIFVLENLGHLPDDFDGQPLLALTAHANHQVRFWAVKNLAKLTRAQDALALFKIAQDDVDTLVRREAVSALGRMRLIENTKLILPFLQDPDPKVVLQAVRGLLEFQDRPVIHNAIKSLATHPNEMIQAVVRAEFADEDHSNQSKKPHPVSPSFMRNVVVNGDVRAILPHVPDESIHLTFTSPPYYNARDYAIYVSYQAYLDFLTEVFRETLRCTKEGRFLIVNTSPVIEPRVSRAHSSKRYPIPLRPHLERCCWLGPAVRYRPRAQKRGALVAQPN
jgi:hypothetical protein